jgi:hypothetical protein
MLLRGHCWGNGQQVKLSRVDLANAWGTCVEFTEGIGNESGVLTGLDNGWRK